ncbi:hypothetical protein FOA52_001273 [Chlamydomonas sp. UWO 241]|nr:hypothetical protein FOA52_001273 [Chlamydomonas sp. UWO 241]
MRAVLASCGLGGDYDPVAARDDAIAAAPRFDGAVDDASVRPAGLLQHVLRLEGPTGFGSVSTADQVLSAFEGSVAGRTVFVVGATSPIARALCAGLARHGARLVLGCRDTSAAEQLAKELRALDAACVVGTVAPCDVSSLQSAADAARAFGALGVALHALVLAASEQRAGFSLSDDGIESHFATNHLGCAALAQALLPALVQGARGASGTAGTHSLARSVPVNRQPSPSPSSRGECPSSFATAAEGRTGGPAGGRAPATSSAPAAAAAAAAACAGAAPTQASVAPTELPGNGSAGAACSHPSRIIFITCSVHQLAYRLMRGYATSGVWRTAVDGQGAARLFMPVQAFALSKLAQILYTRALSERLEASRMPVVVHAVHPGLTAHGVASFGGLEVGSWLQAAVAAAGSGLAAMGALKTPDQAAASVAYALAAPAALLAVRASPPADARGRAPCCGAGVHGCGDKALPRGANNAGGCPPSGSGGGGGGGSKGGGHQDGRSARASVSASGRYIEDCRLSQPAPEARDPDAAAALWQVRHERGAGVIRCYLS